MKEFTSTNGATVSEETISGFASVFGASGVETTGSGTAGVGVGSTGAAGTFIFCC